jgi:hypothetical protein
MAGDLITEPTFEQVFEHFRKHYPWARLATSEDGPAHLHQCGWTVPPRRTRLPGNTWVDICYSPSCGLIWPVENPAFPLIDEHAIQRSTIRWLYEQIEDTQRYAREIREAASELREHPENGLLVQQEGGAILAALVELDASLECSKDALLELWRGTEKNGVNDGH